MSITMKEDRFKQVLDKHLLAKISEMNAATGMKGDLQVDVDGSLHMVYQIKGPDK